MIFGFDIETTGLEYAKGHKIIELAALKYTPKGELTDKMIVRIDPMRGIDADAQAVHGISIEELEGMPRFADIAEQFIGFIADCKLGVAHNGHGFDVPFVEHELKQIGMTLPGHIRWVDTMAGGRWATESGKFPNLGELCFACNVDYEPEKAHAAEYDVDRMMNCFFTAFKHGYFREQLK